MTLLSVETALQTILDAIQPLGIEDISIHEAGYRVLAKDLGAHITQPPFDASAMDGYAVREADVKTFPATLRLVGVSAAGSPWDGICEAGEAVRIFTGAAVPMGADKIVIQENATTDASNVIVHRDDTAAMFIRPRGFDFHQGDILLKSGDRLSSGKIMLAASMSYPSVPVYRKPIVAILATGDELRDPGNELKDGQIASSIPPALSALCKAWGATVRYLGIADDTRASLENKLAAANDANILVTIGGASVGERDLVREALLTMGAHFKVLKIAMRPGKPLMFGTLNEQKFLCLPGNPVSALVCAHIFLRPLIEKTTGLTPRMQILKLMLINSLPANAERTHYMRAKRIGDSVEALPNQDSSLVRTFAHADCLIIRAPFAPPLSAGNLVRALLLDA